MSAGKQSLRRHPHRCPECGRIADTQGICWVCVEDRRAMSGLEELPHVAGENRGHQRRTLPPGHYEEVPSL